MDALPNESSVTSDSTTPEDDDTYYENDDTYGGDTYDEEEEVSAPSPPTKWSFILPAILLIFLVVIWLISRLLKSSEPQYHAHVEPLPGADVGVEEGKYKLRERIVMKKGFEWGPVSSTANTGPSATAAAQIPTRVELIGLVTSPEVTTVNISQPNISKDAITLSAMKDTSDSALAMVIATAINKQSFIGDASGNGTAGNDKQWTLEEIREYIRSRLPISPQDLAAVRCGSSENYLFFQTTRLPNSDQTIIKPSWGNGYCLPTCAYARVAKIPYSNDPTEESKKFMNEKDSSGKYLVEYELALWIDPMHKEAGYTWYCRPTPNLAVDGLGWYSSVQGVYARREVSPVYYATSADPFRGNYGNSAGASDDWNLCSSPFLPIPDRPQLGGRSYLSGSQRWNGKVFRLNQGSLTLRGKPWGIGYNKTDYCLVDFQMIGRYCYWVGHDDYEGGGEDNGRADFNFHGNFSKIPLSNQCPHDQMGYDGVKYNMQLTPSQLSCYYCPKIYEWDEVNNRAVGYDTFLRGSETDNYICVRKCPIGMTDEQTGYLNGCVPIGIMISAEMPNPDPNKNTPV